MSDSVVDHEAAARLTMRLGEPQLRTAIARLLLSFRRAAGTEGRRTVSSASPQKKAPSKAAAQGTPSGKGAATSEDEMKTAELDAIMLGLRLQFVRKLATRLILRDPRTVHARDTLALKLGDSITFLRHDQDDMLTALVNVSLLEEPVTAELACGLGICRATGTPPVLAPAVALLVTATDPTHPRILKSLRVGEPSTESARLRTRGRPGEPVLDEDKALLQLKPHYAVRVGEVVAYEADVTGAVVGAQGSSVTVGAVTKYGVVEAIGEDGQGDLRWINVRTGDGVASGRIALQGKEQSNVVSILSSSLFSFQSARTVASALPVGSPERLSRPLPSAFEKIRNPMTTGEGQNTASSLPAPPPSSGASAAAPPPPPPPAPVGKDELIGAVETLLARANVPLSFESKELLSKLMELNADKEALEADVGTAKAAADHARRDMVVASNRLKCQICISNTVTHCMVPCGHTICETCLGSLPRLTCPFCRKMISSKVRFYLTESDES